MSVHVIKGTGAPTTTPTKSGVHYIDTLAKKQYFSVGTSSVADWVEVGSGTSGSSSGDSGINYITLGKADTGLTGWNTYADAAGVMPVDGKLGTALITFTQSLTTPLRGSADFNLSKPGGVNSQGNGVAYDFSIHRADLAKVLTVSFDYEIISGTYSSGDVTVYLVKDINGTPTVVQPANHIIQNVVGTSKHIATFQTASNVTDYRLCFHVASVSTSDYVLALDNVSVGPSAITASETVCAVYKTAVNQSVANTTFTIVNFGTKEDDSHDSVTTGASWKFTAPIAGRYDVSAKILFNGATSAATGSYLLMLYKNGSQVAELARVNGTGGLNFFGPNGSRIINLNAGDYIDVRAFQDSGGARTLYPFIEYNHISIIKR